MTWARHVTRMEKKDTYVQNVLVRNHKGKRGHGTPNGRAFICPYRNECDGAESSGSEHGPVAGCCNTMTFTKHY
jgi:hypothetical protein